jgi:hypothetical protein
VVLLDAVAVVGLAVLLGWVALGALGAGS